MKKLYLLLAVFLVSLMLVSTAYAQEQNQTEKRIYYFYAIGCSHCANVEASGVLQRIENNSNCLEKLEIKSNPENVKLFNELADKLNIPNNLRGTPLAITKCGSNYSYLVGDTPIINSLEKAVDECKNMATSTCSTPNEKITLLAVILAAMADGIINPCALGVLAFLLIVLSIIGSKKRMIKITSIYILTIFIIYFASGLGLFAIVQSFKITYWVYNLAAIILIIVSLIEIKDYFWYGKGIKLGIPKSKKPLLEAYTRKASIPAAIILGFFVALFELPCTGAFYISILAMLADSMTRASAIPYLLLYNFIFVLPLIIISAIVIFGFPPEKIQNWSESNKRIFRLITGIIMLIIAGIMLFPRLTG
jgi:cytochrome c biogenesis protein CcdA